MEMIAPSGPVYQAGTFSGNPLTMMAGIATLAILQKPGVWESIETSAVQLAGGLVQIAQQAGAPVQVNRAGTMFTLFFTENQVRDWLTAKTCDLAHFAGFHRKMLVKGIYLPPSQFEAGFVSLMHDEKVIEQTLDAARSAFRQGSQRN